MLGTDDKYYECPQCHWAISFHYDYSKDKYVSLCPYCKDRLEVSKDEFERDDLEVYFLPDF